jgi:hypothetical protein
MNRLLPRAAVLVAVLAASSVSAEELRLTTLYRTGTLTKNVGAANIVVRDVVGDSRPDIVSCANGAAFAMSFDGSTYRDAWYSPYNGCSAVAAGDRNGSGTNVVFVGTSTSTGYNTSGPSYIYVYDATSYGPELAKVQVSANEGVTDIALGNVDTDPGLEIVAITSTHFYVYDAATLTLKWSGNYGGHTVAIGDLEGDGINEIVIAGTDGHVLNAAAKTYKWGYIGGFGPAMALGDVDNDGKAEILCGTSPYTFSGIQVINGDTMSVVSVPGSAQSIGAGDVNNDGQIELVTGDGQWGSIRGWSISGTTATQIWSINNPEHGVQGLGVGDPDGDGKNEVVWGAGATSSGADRLYVGNANNQTIEYGGTDLDGPFRVAVGDLDGDGKLEMVVLSTSTESGYSGPAAWVLDYATHRLIAKLTFPYNSNGASQVAIGQVDGDAAKEIVFLGGGGVTVFDGVTFALEWTSPAASYGSGPATGQLLVKNIDGDATDEIIYATADKRFEVLNGASSFVQFISGTLDNNVTDLALADLDGDAVPDLVVCTQTGVYVFKTSDWSQRTYIPLPASNYYRRVAAMPGHFAVTLGGDGLALYSGTTLAQEWSCPSGNSVSDLAFATIGGQQRLAAAMSDGTLRFFPLTGTACPAYDTVSQPVTGSAYGNYFQIAFTDVDGDGRPELLAGGSSSATIAVLGWNSEPRGDANSDGLVTDADIDALAAFLYGNSTATQPAADVNADGAIRPDDLFYLINYRRGTGAPPPAQPAGSGEPR